MRNKILSFSLLCLIIVIGVLFYENAVLSAHYEGLPGIECIDMTKPIQENFLWHIGIKINGEDYPISDNIGHDYGNCLRVMHADDVSGNVIVQSNDKEKYTLRNFFEVWRKTFNSSQIFGYRTGNLHTLRVLVNGYPVKSFENTVIFPNASIEVIYE